MPVAPLRPSAATGGTEPPLFVATDRQPVMDGAPDRSDFWAKLKYKDDDPSTGKIVEWHPLFAHSADVEAVTEEATNVSAEDGGFTFRFSGRSFRYDRFGLESVS